MALVPRVVVVTRKTELAGLLERHGTIQAVRFFLAARGQEVAELVRRDEAFQDALTAVLASLPRTWRRTRVDRADLDRFLFEPEDRVVPIGQDGLVANVAKYLTGQPVIGVNPEPGRQPGVLVRHSAREASARLLAVGTTTSTPMQQRTMVEATLDDGQQLRALNEVFIGQRTHQSARYRLRFGDQEEAHSSSGIVVTTGTGATGWASSIHRQRRTELRLPGPEDSLLAFFVREAWASPTTGTSLTEGTFEDGLTVTSQMPDGGVLFGDGIEDDAIPFGWGHRVTLRLSPHRLCLAV